MMLSAFSMARTGDNFSRDKGSLTPGSLISAIKIEVLGSTVNPACSAIQAAALPATALFNLACSTSFELASKPNIYFSNNFFSFALQKCTL